jgi:Tfp pilus assembly protein PilF
LAHYHLGLYYLEKNDSRTAMFHLKKALDLETDETQKDKIKAALEEIKTRKDF